MIEFEHKLPRRWVGEKRVGTYNNVELGFPSILTTTDSKLGMFIRALRNSITAERSCCRRCSAIRITLMKSRVCTSRCGCSTQTRTQRCAIKHRISGTGATADMSTQRQPAMRLRAAVRWDLRRFRWMAPPRWRTS